MKPRLTCFTSRQCFKIIRLIILSSNERFPIVTTRSPDFAFHSVSIYYIWDSFSDFFVTEQVTNTSKYHREIKSHLWRVFQKEHLFTSTLLLRIFPFSLYLLDLQLFLCLIHFQNYHKQSGQFFFLKMNHPKWVCKKYPSLSKWNWT